MVSWYRTSCKTVVPTTRATKKKSVTGGRLRDGVAVNMVPWWPLDNQTERVHTGGGGCPSAYLFSRVRRRRDLPRTTRPENERRPSGTEAKPGSNAYQGPIRPRAPASEGANDVNQTAARIHNTGRRRYYYYKIC